jgi:amino acid transporter
VTGSAQDQTDRDDARLKELGIKPELKRSLGLLSNFAVAFSYISVSTGTFTVFALAIGFAGPIFFWAWPIVILGQTFVALNFAELASHFPVAGSIYQWSKRLSNRTLGWFTGWLYFWAGVLTTTAVAVTVPLVVAGINGSPDFLASKDPTGITTMYAFVALVTLVITTAINAFGVRLLSIINNLGVATEILGMLVFALILLFFFNHQSPAILFDSRGLESAANGSVLAIFAIGAFIALFVVYGFDTAGTFGEETLDAGRQAPRGILSAIWLSGIIGAVFLLAILLSFQDLDAAIAEGQAFGSPIATTLQQNLNQELAGGITFGELYLFVILASVFVCTMAIQGATTRLMFSMGRDRRLPLGSVWAHVNQTFKTPTNAAIAVGILAALPIVLTGPLGAATIAIAATGMIYLSYFLCNLGVLFARTHGWPKREAFFSLGNWGTVINVLALVYGGIMIINIGLWISPAFGDFGTDLRALTNPFINTFLTWGTDAEGNPAILSGLPAIPVFETLVTLVLGIGAVYYVIAQRGREDAIEADVATGEVTIG